MTYQEWLEESKINEIPKQYKEAFKQATKAAWNVSKFYAEKSEHYKFEKIEKWYATDVSVGGLSIIMND